MLEKKLLKREMLKSGLLIQIYSMRRANSEAREEGMEGSRAETLLPRPDGNRCWNRSAVVLRFHLAMVERPEDHRGELRNCKEEPLSGSSFGKQ